MVLDYWCIFRMDYWKMKKKEIFRELMKWMDKLCGELVFNLVNLLICILLILDFGEYLSVCIFISM